MPDLYRLLRVSKHAYVLKESESVCVCVCVRERERERVGEREREIVFRKVKHIVCDFGLPRKNIYMYICICIYIYMYILYRVYNFPIDFYNSFFFSITTCFFPLWFTKRVIVGLIRASISTNIGRIIIATECAEANRDFINCNLFLRSVLLFCASCRESYGSRRALFSIRLDVLQSLKRHETSFSFDFIRISIAPNTGKIYARRTRCSRKRGTGSWIFFSL